MCNKTIPFMILSLLTLSGCGKQLPFVPSGKVAFCDPPVGPQVRKHVAITGIAVNGNRVYSFCRTMPVARKPDLVIPHQMRGNRLVASKPIVLASNVLNVGTHRKIHVVGKDLWVSTLDKHKRHTLERLDPVSGIISSIRNMPEAICDVKLSSDLKHVLLHRYTTGKVELWNMVDNEPRRRIWTEDAHGCCFSPEPKRVLLYNHARGLLVRGLEDARSTQVGPLVVNSQDASYRVEMICTEAADSKKKWLAISPVTGNNHVHLVEKANGWEVVGRFGVRDDLEQLTDASSDYFLYANSRDVVLVRAGKRQIRRVTTHWGDSFRGSVECARFLSVKPIRVVAGLYDGRTALVAFDSTD